MRITLLIGAVLAWSTVASAQTKYGGTWHPRPTIGVAAGGFKAITRNGTTTPMVSGTVEVPFSDKVRIRIEAARTTLPIVPEGAFDSSSRTDTAHIERLSLSLARVNGAGEFVSGYIGAGVGLHRATFDRAPKSGVSADLYVAGGAELLLSKRLTFDAELGLHGFRDDPWYHRNLITGETLFRLKLAL
jgi:mannose/fructose/N-acetylgalactosamine-specific phosphotransferase system component IIC